MSCDYYANNIRYDTNEEFNVDSKAECDQLNLAHVTKTNKASAQLVQYRFKIREGSPMLGILHTPQRLIS